MFCSENGTVGIVVNTGKSVGTVKSMLRTSSDKVCVLHKKMSPLKLYGRLQLLIDSALEFGMAPVWEGGPVTGIGGFLHVDPHIDGTVVCVCGSGRLPHPACHDTIPSD
jgi:hypothetical protein